MAAVAHYLMRQRRRRRDGGVGLRAINNAGENEGEKERGAGTEEESQTVTYNGEMGANTHRLVPAFSRRGAVITSVSNRKSLKSISLLGNSSIQDKGLRRGNQRWRRYITRQGRFSLSSLPLPPRTFTSFACPRGNICLNIKSDG